MDDDESSNYEATSSTNSFKFADDCIQYINSHFVNHSESSMTNSDKQKSKKLKKNRREKLHNRGWAMQRQFDQEMEDRFWRNGSMLLENDEQPMVLFGIKNDNIEECHYIQEATTSKIRHVQSVYEHLEEVSSSCSTLTLELPPPISPGSVVELNLSDTLPATTPIIEVDLHDMGFALNEVNEWNNIRQKEKVDLYELLRRILPSNLYTNVEIIIGVQTFNCHMIVLQCYSTFFSTALSNKRIKLPESKVKPSSFITMYEWMLKPKTLLKRQGILELLNAATYLGVNDLVDQCWSCLCSDAVNEDVAFLLFLEAAASTEMDFERIQHLMLPRICKFFLTLVSTKEFLLLNVKDLCILLSSNSIGVNCESEILLAIARWLNHDWEERKTYLFKVCSCIRFGLMPPWYLVCLKAPDCDELVRIVKYKHVQNMIHDGVVYSTYKSHYELEGELMGFMERSTINIPTPRQWIYDEKCPYHLPTKSNKIVPINYKAFLNYLKFIHNTGKDHWRSYVYIDPPIWQERNSEEINTEESSKSSIEIGVQVDLSYFAESNNVDADIEKEVEFPKGFEIVDGAKNRSAALELAQAFNMEDGKINQIDICAELEIAQALDIKEGVDECATLCERMLATSVFFDNDSSKLNAQYQFSQTQKQLSHTISINKSDIIIPTKEKPIYFPTVTRTFIDIEPQPRTWGRQVISAKATDDADADARCTCCEMIGEARIADEPPVLNALALPKEPTPPLPVRQQIASKNSITKGCPYVIIIGGIDPYYELNPQAALQKRPPRRDTIDHSNDELYNSENYGDQVIAYDGKEARWRLISHLPFGARHHHAAAVCNGIIYIFGGAKIVIGSPKRTVFESSVWNFDPVAAKWTFETRMPEGCRDFAAIAIDDDYERCKGIDESIEQPRGIYIIGGESSHGFALATVWFYDVKRKTWLQKASINAPRYGFASIVMYNKLWIGGGIMDDKRTAKENASPGLINSNMITDTLEFYRLRCDGRPVAPGDSICSGCDPNNIGQWVRVPFKLRIPRLYGKFCLIFDELYIIGGISRRAPKILSSLNSIDRLDPVDMQWKECGRLDVARHGHSVAALGDRMIIVGGVCTIEQRTLHEVEVFSVIDFKLIKNSPDLPWPLSGSAIVTIN